MLATAYLNWTDKRTGQPRFIKFDACEMESHTQSSEITEHPVEEGSNIGDHVRHNLDQLELNVLVTNTPITSESLTYLNERSGGEVGSVPLIYPPIQPPPFIPTPGAIFAALKNAVVAGVRDIFGLPQRARPDSATALNFPDGAPSIEFVTSDLQNIKKRAILVEVVTVLRIYEDMIITNLEIPRTPKEGGTAVRIKATFKQLRKVQSKLVRAPASTIPRVEKKKDLGKQDTSAEEFKQQSVLKAFADSHGGNPARKVLPGGGF